MTFDTTAQLKPPAESDSTDSDDNDPEETVDGFLSEAAWTSLESHPVERGALVEFSDGHSTYFKRVQITDDGWVQGVYLTDDHERRINVPKEKVEGVYRTFEKMESQP